ncbi:MAG: SpoVR family protein [Granulosicoccus sp.]|nr:SpoVR family protein [Granulosicoccus sp.]
MSSSKRLGQSSQWTFELIEEYDREIAKVAVDQYGLDCYPNQMEIITTEQMLDAYASVGLPLSYRHWSFGKAFISHERAYRQGASGLAYELVINSNPCISYLMEQNSLPMQALVIAHACYGHNSFFKNNYLFQQWTNADAIVDYLVFARDYIAQCEQRHGIDAVEQTIDACHSLRDFGVSRYHHPKPLSAEQEYHRIRERQEHEWSRHDELWSTVPTGNTVNTKEEGHSIPASPEENILYFVEKHSPKLAVWQREIVRIVRRLAQYFYPQGQTKVMNEGWATFWHYTILNRMYDKGLVSDGFMLEVLASHTNVIAQRGFDQRGFGGINPYALGFAMFTDIKRICEEPTEEDRHWFPEIAGSDWQETLDFAMRSFKDESFVSQYLSPKLIREFKFFALEDDDKKPWLSVDSIHNEHGYRRVRQLLSSQYNRDTMLPDIQIVKFDRDGDRSLVLQHKQFKDRPLSKEADAVLHHLYELWGFPVRLDTVDTKGEVVKSRNVPE